jgi:hypothetical protein
MSRRAEAVRKLKNSKRDENDILRFGFKIELACDVGTPISDTSLDGHPI